MRSEAVIKKSIDANYQKGIVWVKNVRAAEWIDGQMVLTGAAADFKEAFAKLMATE